MIPTNLYLMKRKIKSRKQRGALRTSISPSSSPHNLRPPEKIRSIIVNTDKEENNYNNTFKRAQFKTLSGHIQNYNNNPTNNRPYQCPICSKRFSQLGNVQHHFRIHTGERPFQCHLCPNRFTQMTTLNQHLRVHLNLKPYKCNICKRSFRQASNLQFHRRVHAREQVRMEMGKFLMGAGVGAMTNKGHRSGRNKSNQTEVKGENADSDKSEELSPSPSPPPSLSSSLDNHRLAKMHNPLKSKTGTLVLFTCSVCNKCFSLRCHLQKHKCVKESKSTPNLCLSDAPPLQFNRKDEEDDVDNIQIVDVISSSSQQNKDVDSSMDEEEEREDEQEHNGVKLNFIPTSWWYQCRICKVCIQDKEKFLTHKSTKHPQTHRKNELHDPVVLMDLTSSEEDEHSENEDRKPESSSVRLVIKAERTALPVVSSSLPESTDAIVQWKGQVFTDKSCDAVTDTESISERPADVNTQIGRLHPAKDMTPEEDKGQDCKRKRKKHENSGEITDINGSLVTQPRHDEQLPTEQSIEVEGAITPTSENTTTHPTKHKCCICPAAYNFRANLNCHLSIVHLPKHGPDGKVLYKCGLCPETFTVRRLLSDHAFTHTNEHRFKCPSCMEGFLLKTKYKQHSKLCRTMPQNKENKHNK